MALYNILYTLAQTKMLNAASVTIWTPKHTVIIEIRERKVYTKTSKKFYVSKFYLRCCVVPWRKFKLHGVPLIFFSLEENFRGSLLKFFAQIVARGNAVQMFLRFCR